MVTLEEDRIIMKNKVAIITLNGYFNYGNRLQNYALQEVLGDLGCEVETIINDTKFKSTNNKSLIEKIKEKNIRENFKILYLKLINILYKNKLKQRRTEVFKEFSLQYINETDYSITENNIPKDLLNKYDYFITGSDQVWNPYYRKGSPVEFLTFAPKEKRIAYAPSFGISKIPTKYIDNYRLWLSEIAYLSVREETGAKIIKELTGRDATVVLDPTMLLTKEKWLSISKVPSDKPKKGYLLTYFLGKISKERIKFIKNIAKNNNLEIIHLAQIRYKTPYLTGPSEFIEYINSAKIFCTDSFHGAVFSILLETPFIVFSRESKIPSMNSRMETLLSTFKLESRLVENIHSNNQIFEVDYSHINSILKRERDRSINFLKNALNISEVNK